MGDFFMYTQETKMPLKVRVQNYQSIVDSTLIIDGLTTLTGTNNAGKSAFFRALRGAFTNTRGSSFVRLGASHATVDIEDIKTGRTLKWEKGPKVNAYVLDGKRIDRVGHGVPPEVLDAFGVMPLEAGGQSLWPQIAPQMGGVLFLLDQPGSLVAEAVADVERVRQLNSALKLSEKDRKSARSELKVRMKDSKTLSEEMLKFSKLGSVLSQVKELESLRQSAEKVCRGIELASEIQVRLTAAKDNVKRLSGVDTLQADFTQIDNLSKSLSRVEEAKRFLLELDARLKRCRVEADNARKSLSGVQDLSIPEDKLNLLDRLSQAISMTLGLQSRIVSERNTVQDVKLAIETRQKTLSELSAQISTALDGYDQCPTCGGQINTQ